MRENDGEYSEDQNNRFELLIKVMAKLEFHYRNPVK